MFCLPRLMAMGILIAFVAGCGWLGNDKPDTAHIRNLSAHPERPQKKMQSMQHWSMLAEDIASKVEEFVQQRERLDLQSPIYVAAAGTTPFEKGFYDLLLTKMVNKGMQVSRDKNNSLVLSFDLEMLRHSDFRAGEEDEKSYSINETVLEILVNTSLTRNENYVMRDSAIYFINAANWWHYKQNTRYRDPASVNYRLVDQGDL